MTSITQSTITSKILLFAILATFAGACNVNGCFFCVPGTVTSCQVCLGSYTLSNSRCVSQNASVTASGASDPVDDDGMATWLWVLLIILLVVAVLVILLVAIFVILQLCKSGKSDEKSDEKGEARKANYAEPRNKKKGVIKGNSHTELNNEGPLPPRMPEEEKKQDHTMPSMKSQKLPVRNPSMYSMSQKRSQAVIQKENVDIGPKEVNMDGFFD